MIAVAVGIILRSGPSDHISKVLMCQRAAAVRYPLKWEFPGGKLEAGESVETCLRRELFEELSIRADVGELYHRQHSVYPDSGSFDVYYHIIRSFSGTPINNVFSAIAWIPLPELRRLDILEGNKLVIDKLLSTDGSVASKKS